MSHVFISYSRKDKTFADDLELELEARGIDAWTDNDIEPGDRWREGIDNAIKGCFVVLVVMSADAKKSEYVTYEWSYALGVGVTIIPLILRKVKLHPKLEDLQYIDFSGDFGPPFKKLLQRLKRLEVTYLQKSLHHPQYAVRQRAVRRLGDLKVKKAVPELIYTLEHDRSHKIVRPAVADALEAIGTDEAINAARKWRSKN